GDARADAILGEIQSKRADGQNNQLAMQSAVDELVHGRTAQEASKRDDAARLVLAKLANVKQPALTSNQRERFGALAESGMSLHLQALSQLAKARVDDPGAEAAVAAGFEELLAAVDRAPSLLAGVATVQTATFEA